MAIDSLPSRLFAIVLVVTMLVKLSYADCEKIDACSCRDSGTSKVISLHSLANLEGPAFTAADQADPRYTYFYNPCLNFTREGVGKCQNVAVCQEDDPGNGTQIVNYVLGTQPSATFEMLNTSDNIVLRYIGEPTFEGKYRESFIELVCDEEASTAQFKFIEEAPPLSGIYHFTLTTKCACPGGCPQGPPVHPTCSPEGPKSCACRLSTDDKLVNLLSLDNPAAPLIVNTATSKIYFNPCSGMDVGTGCRDSVACVYRAGEYLDYGSPSTSNYSVDENEQVTLSYSSTEGARQTHIRLVCDPSQRHYPRLSDVGEPTSTVLELELRSVCACPGECFGPLLTCSRVDDCTCTLSEGLGSVNLHNLDNPFAPLRRLVEDARWPESRYWYYYNPCTPFSVPGQSNLCVDVAGCQVGDPTPIDFPLGYQNTTTYRVSSVDSSVTLLYTGGEVDRQMAITLHCNESAVVPVLRFDDEEPTHHYYLSLYSKDACPQAATAADSTSVMRKVRPSRPILRV